MWKSQMFSDQLCLHEVYTEYYHFINNCDMYFKSQLKQYETYATFSCREF